jgi:hypothetical protein
MATVSDRPRGVQRRKPARPAHGVARLVLHINGTAYSLHPLWCDGVEATRLYRLRKCGTPTRYVVAETPDGPVCDCPDYTFHREGIDPDGCKHIKAMVATGLITARKGVAR